MDTGLNLARDDSLPVWFIDIWFLCKYIQYKYNADICTVYVTVTENIATVECMFTMLAIM